MIFENIRNLREYHDKKLQKLAEYYGVSIDYIVGRNTETKDK